MSRIFRRGELPVAVVEVLAEVGATNGYGVMQRLGDRVGSGWRPSPGAVYPALLGLENDGLVAGVDANGQRVYRLTAAGVRAARRRSVLDDVAQRCATAEAACDSRATIAAVIDDALGPIARSEARLSPRQEAAARSRLDQAARDLDRILTREQNHG